MRTDQWLVIMVIALMMAAFIWGRYRYDIVAAVALVASMLLGLVPPDKAFTGFSDDIVVIVGCALLLSGAIARSGVMDVLLRRVAPESQPPRVQLLILVLIVAFMSSFVKNIGALAIMIPIALQMARASGVSPSLFLMPMSFASLLGGLMTQVGTSPNVIVSRIREELAGKPFGMFDYTPLGLALTLVGIAFLVLFYCLLPERQRSERALNEAVAIRNYTTEAKVTAQTLTVGKSVRDLQKLGSGGAMIIAIISDKGKFRKPLPDTALKGGDLLIIEGEQEALDRIVSQGRLKLTVQRPEKAASGVEIGAVEAIVGAGSRLIGKSAKDLYLFDAGLTLLAVSRSDERFVERLGEIKIQNGDVLVLQGNLQSLPDHLREWGCLPLVQRDVRLGSGRNGLVPVAVLLGAMALTAIGAIPIAAAFFGAALLVVLLGGLPLRDIYSHIDAPILVMLAALIPVSDALRTTGTTDIIAGWLSTLAAMMPSYGALALILVAAMAVTPFLNNAATVLVMAPIAATFAGKLGYAPEAFLMAVAIGAGCDFLTPIGHQCNTLVMGPGGYRFGDYWRLGLPLSVIVILVAVPLLLVVWPL
ncbi:MAG: anion permease [Rhizobiaceae bacterium]|nr:anion permease [Rhizobiaceae bacterium]